MSQKFKSKKSWREKLEKEEPPKIVDIIPLWQKSMGKGKMVIANAKLVDELARKIPKGKLSTVGLMRERFAKDFKVKTACPLTTGIFLRISAETAEEDKSKGAKKITPYWRVVKDDGSLNPKFPGGINQQANYLESEGFNIVFSKNKKSAKVENFEKYLKGF